MIKYLAKLRYRAVDMKTGEEKAHCHIYGISTHEGLDILMRAFNSDPKLIDMDLAETEERRGNKYISDSLIGMDVYKHSILPPLRKKLFSLNRIPRSVCNTRNRMYTVTLCYRVLSHDGEERDSHIDFTVDGFGLKKLVDAYGEKKERLLDIVEEYEFIKGNRYIEFSLSRMKIDGMPQEMTGSNYAEKGEEE